MSELAGLRSVGIGNLDNSTGGAPTNGEFSEVVALLTAISSSVCSTP